VAAVLVVSLTLLGEDGDDLFVGGVLQPLLGEVDLRLDLAVEGAHRQVDVRIVVCRLVRGEASKLLPCLVEHADEAGEHGHLPR
jgi:hypothetical protein